MISMSGLESSQFLRGLDWISLLVMPLLFRIQVVWRGIMSPMGCSRGRLFRGFFRRSFRGFRGLRQGFRVGLLMSLRRSVRVSLDRS